MSCGFGQGAPLSSLSLAKSWSCARAKARPGAAAVMVCMPKVSPLWQLSEPILYPRGGDQGRD